MDAITELTQINYVYVFLAVVTALAGIKFVMSLFEWFAKLLGLETKWMRCRREEHELLIKTSKELKMLKEEHNKSVRESIKHDQMIKDNISNLTDTVNGIANTLNDMQQRENETKRKELKDSLIRYYNKYKDIGEWTKLESDAFWDLFDDYEDRGGDGYIHSVVEPVMRSLKEVD